jgi:hypothetical protein
VKWPTFLNKVLALASDYWALGIVLLSKRRSRLFHPAATMANAQFFKLLLGIHSAQPYLRTSSQQLMPKL